MLHHRRSFLAGSALAAAASNLPGPLWAQARKDQLTLGLALEPPGLDPTAGAASSIAEVVLYNVFETLTKINADGSVSPLLAERWELGSDLQTCTLHLRRDVRFHNGAPFNAHTVRFAFERAGDAKSTNKDKTTFAQLRTEVLDDYTVRLHSSEVEPDLLFLLGQATAILVEPGSASTNASKPIGTGPYRLQSWTRGAALTLTRWDGGRNAAHVRLARVTYRFIPDPAAQVAALLAGDVDAFARVTPRSMAQFKANARFQVLVSGSRAKTILAMNHARKPLQDVRVRCAIAAAIDRQTIIDAAGDGLGRAIGSHYVPGALGYVDTTGINPYDPERARRLLAQAGVKLPLKLQLTLPPTPYARQGGEIIAAMLAKVGIQAQLHNVEWAQWLAGTYGQKNYDLTLISHVEPLDLGNFAKPGYYWGYQSAQFNALYRQIQHSTRPADRARLLGDAQRLLAQDCVHAFLYQPQWVTVAAKDLRGLWPEMPIFVNDLAGMYWA